MFRRVAIVFFLLDCASTLGRAHAADVAPLIVPRTTAVELEQDRKRIAEEKAIAEQLKLELDARKTALEAERAALQETEKKAETLRSDLDVKKRDVQMTSEASVARFNRAVAEYNARAKVAIEQHSRFDDSLRQYNEMASRYQAQLERLNQLSTAYNEKLRREGREPGANP